MNARKSKIEREMDRKLSMPRRAKMNTRTSKLLSIWDIVLILSVVILSACGPASANISFPTPAPTQVSVDLAKEARAARDAALTFVRETYRKMAPPPDLSWEEELLAPEGALDAQRFSYTAGDWTVTVSCPVTASDAATCRTVVANQSGTFRWEGEMDAAGQVACTPADGLEKWNVYTNEKFGYTVKYPCGTAMTGNQLDEAVQFSGPLVGNEYWTILTVRHYDSDFYRPPAGTDVYEWVTNFVLSYDEISETEIAGLPAVRLATEATPQSDAYDEYYFIQGEHLFSIMILHTGGPEDAALYDLFLESFTFAD